MSHYQNSKLPFCDNYATKVSDNSKNLKYLVRMEEPLVTIFFSHSMVKSWVSAVTRKHEIGWKG